jgi:hypothetical protein
MAYYELSKTRVAGHEEPIDQMARHGILIDGEGVVDGGETRILLQIFSRTVIGPIFFEFIQGRATTASAKATSAPSSRASSRTRSTAASSRPRADLRRTHSLAASSPGTPPRYPSPSTGKAHS